MRIAVSRLVNTNFNSRPLFHFVFVPQLGDELHEICLHNLRKKQRRQKQIKKLDNSAHLLYVYVLYTHYCVCQCFLTLKHILQFNVIGEEFFSLFPCASSICVFCSCSLLSFQGQRNNNLLFQL